MEYLYRRNACYNIKYYKSYLGHKMLAEIYEIKCDYEKALMYIDLAIRCNIEEQASVNSSFLYYTRARIYDKIFSEDTQREGAKLYAQNAVADYETAINIGRLSQITERLANQRKAILKKHLPEIAMHIAP